MDEHVSVYPMKKEPFGKLLIFYNTKNGFCEPMESCKLDADLMEKTFGGKFNTVRFENKTLKEMNTILNNIEIHLTEEDSCLICYFSSFGDNDCVCTSDGEKLPYHKINESLRKHHFRKNGKPILVILDISQQEEGGTIYGPSHFDSIEAYSDFAILKAAPNGYPAYSFWLQPSVFTSAFCKAFEESRTNDFTDIVHETTAIMKKNKRIRQFPESISYLAARLIFKSSPDLLAVRTLDIAKKSKTRSEKKSAAASPNIVEEDGHANLADAPKMSDLPAVATLDIPKKLKTTLESKLNAASPNIVEEGGHANLADAPKIESKLDAASPNIVEEGGHANLVDDQKNSKEYTDIVLETTVIIAQGKYSKQCVPESVTYLSASLIFESYDP